MYIKQPILILALLTFGACQPEKSNSGSEISNPDIIQEFVPPAFDSLHLLEALKFTSDQNLATDFAILINLSHHSGNYRLFGMNLETGDTILKSLVAHGHCKGPDGRIARFSNDVGSNCSSVGKYRIGGKYEGEWGTSFKLLGLENSNDNAEKRYVVLHGHECVPDSAVADDICLSEGCPTVSPKTLRRLETIIDNHSKRILLWIFSYDERAPERLSTAELQKRTLEQWKSSKK